ncbi:MAG: T9SS type A sorting domain-containing protein, partial [candidate division Zixibacteria bacterium]|nr:T9SS type A sorting domain-containing protein [candidate division Zixibacteria bacterium]
QNYPNPFNPTTQVNFDVPTHSQVNISVFNVLGQKTVTLVDEEMNAGSYVVDWDGTSDGGNKVSSGIYFYRMEAGSFVETKKMMLLK